MNNRVSQRLPEAFLCASATRPSPFHKSPLQMKTDPSADPLPSPAPAPATCTPPSPTSSPDSSGAPAKWWLACESENWQFQYLGQAGNPDFAAVRAWLRIHFQGLMSLVNDVWRCAVSSACVPACPRQQVTRAFPSAAARHPGNGPERLPVKEFHDDEWGLPRLRHFV